MSRFSLRLIALLVSMLALAAPFAVAAQETPPPKPEDVPFFVNATDLFTEEQLQALRRDGELLQSTEIPTLVYVREVNAAEADPASAQSFANDLRHEWDIESSNGADDGLVLLVSWVAEDPQASTAVFSYGRATFEGSGLTPESIQETIDTSVASLIDQGHPFETLIYLMRETRYTGIYAPPPPPPIEGAARAVHDALMWFGPGLASAAAVILITLSMQFWRERPAPRQIWTIAGATIGASVLLWRVSVYAQSRVGVASALIVVALLALFTWLWTHKPFTSRHARPIRTRAVPPTRRILRKRHQARQMLLRGTGEGR